MNTPHSNPHLRRVLTFVALAATLGLSAVSLTQCRLIDGTVTGVDARKATAFNNGEGDDDNDDSDCDENGSARARCRFKCRQDFRECLKKEDSRFRAALRDCDRLTTKDKRQACKEYEERMHRRNHEQCVRDKQICKKNCRYREGSGNGGR